MLVCRMRRSFNNVRVEIEKEIGMDEIRRQLHNEAVMEEMKRIERDVRSSVRAGEQAVGTAKQQITTRPESKHSEPSSPGNDPGPDSGPGGADGVTGTTSDPAGADDRKHG